LFKKCFANEPVSIIEVPVERPLGDSDAFAHIFDTQAVEPISEDDVKRCIN
jgi:hypothetical protein